MNRFYSFLAAGLTGASLLLPATGQAIGWPSNYQGVMLQGFYWDSYDDTKWTNLEAQADELSKYFSLIWIPNSGKCEYMGYMPKYWFTNHNSAFGTEKELLSMISTFKQKGTGFIADCVINHRNGVTGWYDFPVEEWNGKTWSIGLDGICCNDEMNWAAGQPKPTGGYDTGDNFDGCRDLDHTNPNVQDNCKNYVKCLIEKYGYAGMRYDMVKGYSGYYNGIYNEYANVEFSVGEYWDSNYDNVAAWIEATGKRSAAFDFPLKYALNEGLAGGDLRKLVWKANGTTDQPAGMIHWWYPQYSVTFVDNHDTYRDGSKYTGNVVAANAFILMSPGTPCVFLPHYQDYKKEIQRLITVRNAVGIHNQSSVKVLRSEWDCYMAEVDGVNGKAVVKVGGAMVSPEGYSSSDIKAVGNDYCVWTKVAIPGDSEDDPQDSSKLYIQGHVENGGWITTGCPELTGKGNVYSGEFKFTDSGDGYSYFSFTDGQADDWGPLNNTANRYGAAEKDTPIAEGESADVVTYARGDNAWLCQSWKVLPGTYTVTVDLAANKLTLGKVSGDDDDNNDDNGDVSGMPEKFYILGHANGNDWHYAAGVEMTKEGGFFTATVDFAQPALTKADTDPYAYFSFAKSLGSSWDEINVMGNRFAPAEDTTLNHEGDSFALTESASPAQAKAYRIMPGKYEVKIDWAGKNVSIQKVGQSSVGSLLAPSSEETIYFNLQGVRVAVPNPGELYIRIKNGKPSKIRF